MKKILSFIILMVCAVTGAWADVTVSLEGTTLTITTQNAGELANPNYSFDSSITKENVTKLVLVGKFSDDDLKKVSKIDGGFSSVTDVDISGATFVDKYPSANTPTGSVSDYSWFKTQAIANASGVKSPTKAIVGGTLYKASIETEKKWNTTTETWNCNTIYADDAALEAAKELVPVGSYAKVPKAYKYCQMNYTSGSWSKKYSDGSEGVTTTYPETDFQNNSSNHFDEIESDKVIFYHYYILTNESWHQWVQSDKDTYDNTVPEGKKLKIDAVESFANGFTTDNLYEDTKRLYNDCAIGSVLQICVCYEKNYTKTWSDPVDALPGSVTDYVDGNFDVSKRDDNKEGYSNGQWVRMYSAYDYYVLGKKVKSRSWDEVTDKDNVALSYVYPEGTDITTANTTATDGQYAVVGGTEYVFDGTEWNAPGENTYMVNWEKMQKKDELKSKYWPDATIDDGDYVRLTTDNVYDVHVTRPGSLAKKFAALSPTPAEGAVFRFDSKCTGFTAEDLQALAPMNNPHVYIDFYDVTATEAVETAIENAVKGLDTSNRHYRGLLLPKNPQKIGTTLIILPEGSGDGSKSACSEFIAYNSGEITAMHIYHDRNNVGSVYEDNLAKVKEIMDAHVKVENENTIKVIEDATKVYLVSTNYINPINDVESIMGESTTASVVHTYNNELVKTNTAPTEPTILVMPATPGDYATLNSKTNIRNTPNTDVLKFSGRISEADILAVNSFTKAHWDNDENGYVENTPKEYNGPKVLDLSEIDMTPKEGLTDITATDVKTWLSQLNNPKIEYIILPAGMDAPVVGDYTNLANLKCVLSTDGAGEKEGDKVLTAYVRKPGSLAEARTYATGLPLEGHGIGLNKVKLYGKLVTDDIKCTGNGFGLSGEDTSIKSLDLADAVFVNADGEVDCTVMDFRTYKNSTTLEEVILPTNEQMTTIPANCFEQLQYLKEVCIPINYTRIESGAFTQSGVCHITTTDSKGNLVDMGENTYVLPENLTFIGTHSFDTKSKTVTDVYVQSITPPVCEKDAFSTEMTWGDGGADFNATKTNGVYCRDVFNNGDNAVAILHFPAQEESGLNDTQYRAMAAMYTDITKEYTKKDQTGAVDANGNPLFWPIETEFKRSFNQASTGYLWRDAEWEPLVAANLEQNEVYKVTSEATVTDKSATCDFSQYIGWHQFVLCFASFMPTEESDEREYEQDGWHTFCIPFDMTKEEVVELMGVPKSEGSVINRISGKTYDEGVGESDDILPEIRTIHHVERQLITSTNKGSIHLVLSNPLVNENGMGVFPKYHKQGDETILRNGRDNDGEIEVYEENGYIGTEPVILRAGYPYMIKPYKRKGETRTYLGQYVMTHHTFPQENSAVMMVNTEGTAITSRHHNNCWIDLIQSSDRTDPRTRVTKVPADASMNLLKGIEKDNNNHDKESRFAIPYEGHRFKATVFNESGAADGYDDVNIYRFQGNFWKQPLPLNCYYLNTKKATHKWYYYKNYSSSYVWHPYTCILGVGLDVKVDDGEDVYGGSNILDPIGWDGIGSPVFKRKFQLGYEDMTDDSFTGMSHAREIRIVFDDAITEFGEDGQETTAIETLDGQMLAPVTGKIYNLRGQYVGNSVDGLPKGLYIVNGRKVVVD